VLVYFFGVNTLEVLSCFWCGRSGALEALVCFRCRPGLGRVCSAKILEVLIRFRCGLRGCPTVSGERSGADRFSGWSIGFRRRAKACVCIVKDFVRDSSPTSPFDFRGQGVRNGAE
jgi:hypothetical protein